jgi:hypothetical protein
MEAANALAGGGAGLGDGSKPVIAVASAFRDEEDEEERVAPAAVPAVPAVPAGTAGVRRSRFGDVVPTSTVSAAAAAATTAPATAASAPSSSFLSLMIEEALAAAAPPAKRSRFGELVAPAAAAVPAVSAPSVPAAGQSSQPALTVDTDSDAPWILPSILVKIANEKLGGGRFFGLKGTITSVLDDGYVAVVRVMDPASQKFVSVKIDQTELETTVTGAEVVMVLRPLGQPAIRGQQATVVRIDRASESADLRLTTGPKAGTVLSNVHFDNFSKVAPVT